MPTVIVQAKRLLAINNKNFNQKCINVLNDSLPLQRFQKSVPEITAVHLQKAITTRRVSNCKNRTVPYRTIRVSISLLSCVQAFNKIF